MACLREFFPMECYNKRAVVEYTVWKMRNEEHLQLFPTRGRGSALPYISGMEIVLPYPITYFSFSRRGGAVYNSILLNTYRLTDITLVVKKTKVSCFGNWCNECQGEAKVCRNGQKFKRHQNAKEQFLFR